MHEASSGTAGGLIFYEVSVKWLVAITKLTSFSQVILQFKAARCGLQNIWIPTQAGIERRLSSSFPSKEKRSGGGQMEYYAASSDVKAGGKND